MGSETINSARNIDFMRHPRSACVIVAFFCPPPTHPLLSPLPTPLPFRNPPFRNAPPPLCPHSPRKDRQPARPPRNTRSLAYFARLPIRPHAHPLARTPVRPPARPPAQSACPPTRPLGRPATAPSHPSALLPPRPLALLRFSPAQF